MKGIPFKNAPLSWTAEHQKEFDHLKKLLTDEPVMLHIFDPTKPVYLHTDWSQKAIGGWISQEIDGRLAPIAYES